MRVCFCQGKKKDEGTGSRTQAKGFKVLCANRYTIPTFHLSVTHVTFCSAETRWLVPAIHHAIDCLICVHGFSEK